MRVAICDDDAIFVNSIYQSIWNEWDCDIDTFSNPIDLLKQYEQGNFYHVIFCDIMMEPYDGIEVGRKIRTQDKDAILVYLTSNLNYAPLGYEVSAFRYLLKPINTAKLQSVIKDIQLERSFKKKLLLETEQGSMLIPVDSILFIEAQDKESVIFCTNDTIYYKKSLSELEEELKEQSFYRIHRKYLVNLNRICEFDTLKLTLDNNRTLPVSRRKSKSFQATMQKFIRGI